MRTDRSALAEGPARGAAGAPRAARSHGVDARRAVARALPSMFPAFDFESHCPEIRLCAAFFFMPEAIDGRTLRFHIFCFCTYFRGKLLLAKSLKAAVYLRCWLLLDGKHLDSSMVVSTRIYLGLVYRSPWLAAARLIS
jgi:hypothetical protein